MWLASLRRLVVGNSRCRKERRRLAARSRKGVRLRLEMLEERLTPSGGNPTVTQTAGSYAALTAAIASDTAANTDYVIQITNNFTFDSGGQVNIALLGSGSTLTIEGQNGTNYTLTGNGNRLFDIAKGQTVTLEHLTLTGGLVSGSTAQGGAVYNSGNLSMKSVVVAGNQAIGGSGQNAAGGGIYSNGGSLTLSHDIIGRAAEKSHVKVFNYKTHKSTTAHTSKIIGASNKAVSGAGASAQGGGLYVAGGSVNVSNCTIAGNQVSGSVSAQGGGLYVAGVAQLNLTNNLIGNEKYTQYSFGVTPTSQATFYAVSTKTKGSANKAIGGSAMGGGLYVFGGTVSVSQGVIGGNQAAGGAGQNAAGGGIYSVDAVLTCKTVALPGNQAIGGAASSATGNNGGSAQGGGLFISGGSVSLTNCHLAHMNANYASGGATGANGGPGGNGGSVQGGGIYVQNTTLTLTGGVVTGIGTAGDGGNGTTGLWTGGAGGNAQGGVIFALNSTVTASGTQIAGNARPGNGGAGANGTSQHSSGGMGGAAGFGQGGAIYVKGGSLTLTDATEVSGGLYKGQQLTGLYQGDFIGAQGGRGGAAYNGTSGVGGAGGQGNSDEGGGVFASNATVIMEASATIQDSEIHAGVGGPGGNGKIGGQGGAGGTALGGGMFVQGGSVSLSGIYTGIYDSSLNANPLPGNMPPPGNGGTGGTGGSGTLPGNGGKGGDAYGGGLYALSASVTLNNGAVLESNLAFSGQGGSGQGGITGTPTTSGGNGSNGGAAGMAVGGGAYLAGAGVRLQINAGLSNAAPVEFLSNAALGGYGGIAGSGGKGGQRLLGGISNPTSGTQGGNGGTGGNGGIAEGGGLAVEGSGNTIINLNNVVIFGNQAQGGEGGFGGVGGEGSIGSWAGGNGGSGGVAGSALGGGVYVQQGALTLTNASIEDNIAMGGLGGPGAGGGVAEGLTAKETKTVGGGGIAGNGGLGNIGGTAQGGGLYVNASTVTMNAVALDFNGSIGGQGGQGGNGGVTLIYRVNPPGYDRKSSSGNSAGNGGAGQGGAVFATGNSVLTAMNTDISYNGAHGGAGGTGGAGGYYYYSSRIYYTGGNGGAGGAGGNAGVGQGGGVYVNGGAFTLVNSTVANNELLGGAGGAGGNGGNGSVGQDYGGSGGNGGNGGNAAPISGGGIFATTSALKLINATLANNTLSDGPGGAGGNGGNAGSAKAYLTVPSRQGVGGNAGNGGNAASGQGGGLYLGSGSVSLLNATFAYNTITAATPGAAGKPGQGIVNNATTPPTQLSPDGQPGSPGTTSGTDQAGGLYVGPSVSTASLENTILALNTAATDTDVFGTFSSSDDDFIGDGTGSNLSNGVHGDIVGQYTIAQLTSFFGQLGYNFGPTQTIVPMATSPTIGTGDPSAAAAIAAAEGVASSSDATDQRGLPRLVNGLIDIGATELQVDFTGTPSVTTVQAGQTGQTITYTVNVTNGEGEPINVTLTDEVPPDTSYVSGSAGGSVSGTAGGTGWTITEPSTANSNTLTATATLNPGATATLTFTVTVASNASGTITDIANLAWTGANTNTTGSLSVPMNTTVIGGVSSTTTQLTSSGNPSVYGQPVTFQATVSSAGTPTGEVVFEDGNTILAKEALTNGVATFTTSTLSVGSHSITAIYCGDANDSGSTSNTVTQVVNQDSTTTTLASSIIPSVYGQSVMLTATVSANSPGSGTPTGTVTFYEGTTELGTGTLSGGVATFSIASLSVGNHSITAIYGGDTNDAGSTSNTVIQSVDQDSTTTTLASSQPSVYGQPVTFTATVSVVSPGAGTPTGTVTFEDGSTVLGTVSLDNNGVATFRISTLAVGSHSITAVYGGDANDLGSTSNAVSQVVNQDTTTTTLTSSANPIIYGQPVTFTATVSVVSPGVGTPTGSVDFVDTTTGADLGTVALSSDGTASITVSNLPVGPQVVEAIYSGDANDLGSSGTLSTPEQVNYKFCLLPPVSLGLPFEVNRTIPILFLLTDNNGCPITSLSAVTSLQIQALDSNGNPVGAPFTPVSTNKEGLQNVFGAYLYLWQTKGLSAGSYAIEVKLADGTTHTKTIQLVNHGSGCWAGLTTDSSDSTATAGGLLGGEVDLYVDNSNGELTSDELARITDAVNTVDATVAPYGVSIVLVSDPTQANATLSMDTTSALGGVAQGVLGVTTDADQVTMIQGWDWYAGSDPTQIGSGQYDFGTAVIHELGHVLGLGHSSDSSSVMYATLAMDTANRNLAVADLNVPDGGSGSDALHATPITATNGTSLASSLSALSSTSVPTNSPSQQGAPLSITDQVFADFALLLNNVRNAYQAQLSSALALWQQADAQAVQRLDALLSLEASALGMFKDARMFDLLFTDKSL